jgi:Kae1-associated kinase Bud32
MEQAVYRGAESKLYRKKWLGYEALIKKRLSKKYRIPELDHYFRKQRTIFEGRLLSKAKEAGVRTPIIYSINPTESVIIMEYIRGEMVKELFSKMSRKRQLEILFEIGQKVGLLHTKSIVHGDLTTSNILLEKEKENLVFIDFGLGYISDRLEDFGIDLFLFERAFHSTHSQFFEKCWPAVLEGYKTTGPFTKQIDEKIEEIGHRGRYSERM